MAKKNRKPQPQGELQGEIKGVLLITLGVLILISVLSSSSSGILGNAVRKILVALMGLGAYVFPIIFIFIGICFILRKNNFRFSRKFYGIIIFIINTLLTLQMIIMGNYYTEGSTGVGITRLYESSSAVHGGIISYLIDIPLYKLLGSAGSYVVFAAVYIVSFILISRITLYDVLSFLKGKFRRSEKPAISEKTRETAKPQTEGEKDSYVKGINSRIFLDGKLTMLNGSSLIVKAGSSVKIYLNGNVEDKNSAGVGNENTDARTLMVFATDNCTQIAMKTKGDFFGAIFQTQGAVDPDRGIAQGRDGQEHVFNAGGTVFGGKRHALEDGACQGASHYVSTFADVEAEASAWLDVSRKLGGGVGGRTRTPACCVGHSTVAWHWFEG